MDYFMATKYFTKKFQTTPIQSHCVKEEQKQLAEDKETFLRERLELARKRTHTDEDEAVPTKKYNGELKVHCPVCNSTYRLSEKSSHQKTKKHINNAMQKE